MKLEGADASRTRFYPDSSESVRKVRNNGMKMGDNERSKLQASWFTNINISGQYLV